MPRPRFDNVSPEKKQKLIDVATKEFATHGYELASINRILEAAELSKGAFYYYFDDKDDLAVTVLVALAEPDANAFEVREVHSADEFWAELMRVSMDRLRQMESNRLKYEAILRLTNAVVARPELAARLGPLFAPGRIKMAGLLEQGVRFGALRSDIPLGAMMQIIEAMKTALYKATFVGDRVPSDVEIEAFSDQVMDLARRISAPPATPTR